MLQKLNIVLRSELLINKLEDESKKNSMKNLRHSSTASEDAIDKKKQDKHENSGDDWNYISTFLNIDSEVISD